ncbi:MAG: hypothetical protein HZB56_16715 [Deltaproteobacteria bacterium]|nr:hypothetical protein [Deltaproteobacteria bacterium]
MEIGESVAVALPPAGPEAPPKAKFKGVLKGPAGPLKSWPFLFKKDGKAVDQGGLGGGSSSNSYRNGAWWSDGDGKFEFKEMPEGYYAIEVLLPTGQLQEGEELPAAESGRRAPALAGTDRNAFSEAPHVP